MVQDMSSHHMEAHMSYLDGWVELPSDTYTMTAFWQDWYTEHSASDNKSENHGQSWGTKTMGPRLGSG